MPNFEHHPTTSPSFDKHIRELLEGHDTAPRHYQDIMYAAALSELRNRYTSFDDIRKLLAEYGVPGANDIEPAEEYQPLLEELYEGRLIKFQRSDGNFYIGVIDGEPKLDIYVDYPQSRTVAVIEVPIDYEGEIDRLSFYPRRSHGPYKPEESDLSHPKGIEPEERPVMLLPGIKLL